MVGQLIQFPRSASPRTACRDRRRGVASVLAMLFLVLFGTLALGFYAMVTMAVATSRNELRTHEARIAAESGLEFIQYHMQRAQIVHVGPTQYMDELHANLFDAMDGSANLLVAGSSVALDADDVIHMPETGYIALDDKGLAFRATITPLTTSVSTDQKVRVQIRGRSGYAQPYTYRVIDVEFLRRSASLDYGMATLGTFVTSGASHVYGADLDGTANGPIADVFSAAATTPAITMGGKTVGGDLYTVNSSASAVLLAAGASVGGTTNAAEIQADHIHRGMDRPEFPTVDSSKFVSFATTPMTAATAALAANATLTNVRILPAGSAVPAQVTLSGKTIKGVLYIQAPNNIRFDGGTMMEGIIVTDATPGSPTSNLLTFSGNVTMTGVESLNPATFGDLPNLGGSLILAPNFHITFTGTSGVAGGTMAGGQFTFSGNTGLNLHGSVIGLDPTKPMTVGGSGSITIKPPTWNGVPTGLTFQKATKGFQPVFSTFSEVPQ